MPLRSKKVVVPLRGSPLSPIVIKVTFKKRQTARTIDMIMDTGATFTTIPSELAVEIGCDPTKPERRIEMITASGMEYVSIVKIPSVMLLGFKLNNVEAACLNLPPKSCVEGLLGLNVLKNFDIWLAFRKKLLEFQR